MSNWICQDALGFFFLLGTNFFQICLFPFSFFVSQRNFSFFTISLCHCSVIHTNKLVKSVTRFFSTSFHALCPVRRSLLRRPFLIIFTRKFNCLFIIMVSCWLRLLHFLHVLTMKFIAFFCRSHLCLFVYEKIFLMKIIV